MAKVTRSWTDLSLPVLDTPQLDNNNLPVETTPTIDPSKFNLPGNFDYNFQTMNTPYRRLEGQGQPIWDEESMAAAVQPFAAKIGSGLVSRGASLIPKFGQNIGHIAGAVQYGMDYLSDPATADPNQIWNNGFVNTMSKMDQALRDALPIYKSHYGREGNLLQQMKDPAFWVDDFFDSLAFMGSAYVTGIGLGAVSKGLGLAKALAGEGAAATKLMGQKIQVYGATLVNSIGEAGFEAKDFQDSERDKMSMRDFDKPYTMLEPEQKAKVDGLVGIGASNVFKGNLGVLIVPNYIQSKFMFGSIGKAAGEMRQAVRAGTLAAEDINTWSRVAKGIGLSSISEGLWEEGMQNALQTYSSKKESYAQNIDDYVLGVANEWVDNLTTVQAQKNMVLGALVGSLFGGFGAAREATKEREEISKEQDTWSKLKTSMSSYDKWYIEHISTPYKQFKSTVKETQPDGTIKDVEIDSFLNPNGQTEIDIDKAEKMFLYMLHNKFLFDEAMTASINADNLHLETINKDALARRYFAYATNPGMSSLDEVDQLFAERELSIPKELADQGYKNQYSEADVKPLRKAFEESVNQMMSKDDFTQSASLQAFKNLSVKMLFGEQIKRNMLENALTKNISDSERTSIEKLIKDSETLSKKLTEKKTQEKLYEDYKAEQDMMYDARDKLAQLRKDPNTKQSDIDRALYEQQEFFYINGEENPFSTAFPLQEGIPGSSTAQGFGARYNYFHDLGNSYWRKADTNKDLEEASKGRKPLSDVVNKIVNNATNGTAYTQEELDRINNSLNQREGYLKRTERTVIEKQEKIEQLASEATTQPLDEDGLPEGDPIPGPNFDAIQKEIAREQKYIDTHEALRMDHERAKASFQGLIENLPAKPQKVQKTNEKKTYRKFQREFADQPVEREKDIMKSYNGNKNAYDNISELDQVISDLEDRKKIYNMPGRKKMLTTNEFKGFIESVDAAIDELKSIRDTVAENMENRKIIDKKSRINYSTSLFNAIGIKVDRMKHTHVPSNQLIYDTIAKIIGKDVLNGILTEASNAERDGIDYSYDAIYVEKIIALVKDNDAGKKELFGVLDTAFKTDLGLFIDNYNALEAKKKQASGSQMDIDYYKKNPEAVFGDLLDVILNRYKEPLSKMSILDEFLRDRDAFKLYDSLIAGAAIGYDTISKEELKGLLEQHIALLGIDKLKQRLMSKTSINEIIEIENAVIRGEKLAPSNQQHIALREAILQLNIALSIKEAGTPFKGWSYLKGLAGTGKTTIFARWLMKLNKLGPEAIVGLSTHENALEVLKNNLEGVENVDLVENFDYDKLSDEKIQIILVDEVARLAGDELLNLAGLIAEANSKRKLPLRVYVFGDPSQVSSRSENFPAISNFYYDMINIRHLNPLTSVFRSGNSAVIRAQNAFLDMPGKVKTFLGIATDDIGKSADGVHVSNLKSDLRNQIIVHQKNQRSKVIVVSNIQDAAFYNDLGVPVMQYFEVAGLQFDEVYVDLDPKDFEQFGKAVNRKFNEAMYTATSRTKDYMFVKSYEPLGNWKYRVDKISKEDNTERNNELLSEYTNRLAFEAEVLGMDIKNISVASPQILKATEKDEEDTSEPQTEQEPAQEEVFSTSNIKEDDGKFEDDLTIENAPHELEYPFINKESRYNEQSYVRAGSRVKYLKVWNSSKKIHEIWVVAQHINNDGSPLEGNIWERVGIMSKNELLTTELGKRLMQKSSTDAMEGTKHVSATLSNGNIGTIKGSEKAVLAEGSVRKASPLSYTYSDNIVDQGVGFLKDLMNSVRGVFSNPSEENLTFTVEMFSISDPEIMPGVKLTPGVPFLIIKRKTTKEGEEFGRRTQFVRLAARKINSTDSIIKSVEEFEKAIVAVEELGIGQIGDPKVNELLKKFRENFEAGEKDGKKIPVPKAVPVFTWEEYQKKLTEKRYPVINDQATFDKLSALSKVIIPGYYGIGESKVEVANQYMMEEYLGEDELNNVDYTYEFVPHPVKEGGYILRKSKTDESKKEYVTDEEGLKAGKGIAQIALNVIAKANGNQKWTIRKKITTYPKGKKTVTYITQAKGLLSEKTSTVNYLQHLTNIYKAVQSELEGFGIESENMSEFMDPTLPYTDEENITRLENILLRIKESDTSAVEGISAEEFARLRKEYETSPITSAQLSEIVTFDENGSHAQLNLPLKMNGPFGLNELGKNIDQNINQLEDLLGSKLVTINKTRIQVNVDPVIKTKNVAVGDKKTVIQKGKDVLNNLRTEAKKRGDRRMDYSKDEPIGEPISLKKAREILEKLIPTINSEGKDVIKFVDEVILANMAGRKAFGLYRNEVIYAMQRGTVTFKNIIRHEAFHKIFTEHLSKREQNLIVNAFRKEFPQHKNKSKIEIEELLARTFQDYQSKKTTKIGQVLRNFFNWLAKNLGFINMNLTSMDSFFATIESGYFVTKKNSGIGITSAMKDIIRIYGYGSKSFAHALDIYRESRSIIQDKFFNIHENGFIDEDGKSWPVTRREIRSIAENEIAHKLIELLNQKVYADDSLNGYSQEDKDFINSEIKYYQSAVDNYDKIVSDIYQNWNFDVPGEIMVDTEMSTEEIMELYSERLDDVNLKDHIIQSDEVNQESKISMAVKDFLSNIQLSDGKWMSWREAYIRTLQLMEGLQPESAEFMKQLKDAWNKNGKELRSGKILEYLQQLESDALRINYGRNGTDIPGTMKFINEDIFAYGNDDISDVSGPIGAEQKGAITIKRRTGEDTRSFIIRLESETGLDESDITGHFEKYLNLNTYRSIINLFNNMKQKNIFVLEKEWIGAGTYSIKYIPGSYLGSHLSLAGQLNANIREYFPDKKSVVTFRNKWIKENQAKFVTKAKSSKIEFVRAFLKEMRMGQLANSIPNVEVDRIYNDILGFFKRAEELMEESIATITPGVMSVAEDVVELTTTMSDILDKERKMVSSLSKLMSASSANMRATSVRDITNKRKYIWSPASFAHNIFYNIINSSLLPGGHVSLSLPGYLQTNYFKKNIFLSGKNRVFDVVDHDGIRNIGFKGTARGIKQSRENTQDYIVRTFIAGFLDRIKHSSEGKETYFQFSYPNERENAFGAEVKILTLPEIKSALEDAIRQINEAPQLSGIEVNNKNKFYNFRLLQDVIGKRDLIKNPLKEHEISKLSDKIMGLLRSEANKAAKTIIENRVPFDSQTAQLTAINRILGYDSNVSELKNSKLFGKETLKSISNEEYNIKEEDIIDLVYAYVANNYVNSYFLNQLILGDYNQFLNEEDIMRRFSLATAPGFKPFVNKIFGMPEKARFLVMDDEFKNIKDIEGILNEILTDEEKEKLPILMGAFKDNFALGDGQGFMLPERFEQLRNSGFASEFSLHRIVKPVIFTISADGVVRGVKYSAVVLSDELIEEFPSLGKLRNNIRRSGAMEAVFRSAVKIGLPESSASFSDMLKDDYIKDSVSSDAMSFDVLNDHYRIQLDPKSDIDSHVSQPSQLMYLAGILEQNIDIAKRLYYNMSEISRLGSEKFFQQFGNANKISRNISSLLHGKGNEKAYDMLTSGLSINFPSISNKVIIQLASHFEKLLVDIKFPGTKLVLQSEYGARKYNQLVEQGPSGKLKYIRTKDGRLVAEVIVPEGLLPKEYEDLIKAALKDKKNAQDYFDMPDLLGFRIPSSDIHSGIAMKVVGFYTTPDVNVIIAPDLLVALHGSDFDVDSLFVIKREKDTNGDLAGYVKKKGRMTYIRDINYFTDKWNSIEDTIAYRKNGMIHELLDLISSKQNVDNMLSPIPLRDIKDQKARVLAPGYHPRSNQIDLSNFNDQIDSHETIFGASVATGIFGNAAKGLSYMLRTAIDGTMPSLRDKTSSININGKDYNTISVFDDEGKSLFVSIDGFINASIDNIRELALPILNINLKTIKGFLALRAMGVPLSTTIDILQQPAILEYTRKNNYDVVQGMINEKLGGQANERYDQNPINDKNLLNGIKQGMGIEDMKSASNSEGGINSAAYRSLMFQSHILSEFKKMNSLGDSIGNLAIWLKIARATPNNMIDIEKSLNKADSIFGPIEDDGTLSNFEASTFPFDISTFFIKNPHILQAYKSLNKFSSLVRSSIKKHDVNFEKLVDKVYAMIDGMNLSKEDSRELIRDEIITYLLSNEIYSGEYKLNKDVVFTYEYGNETRYLTGPKAINQIFIGKIDAMKNYLANKTDKEGFPLTNMFLSFLHSRYNGLTKTYDLQFDGGPSMDPMDVLDIKEAFMALNRYEVKWNKKSNNYTVVERTGVIADDDYSAFQKEFVSYGIMNWGLKFGSSNYSMVLPEGMYKTADVLFNRLMDKFIGSESEENWKKIEDDFMIQFVVNNGNQMQDVYFDHGLPIDTGIRFENDYGKTRTFYGGQTSQFYYDRAYDNSDKKDFKKFIITKYEYKRTVYMRMNEADADIVYYQRVDLVSPLKYYNTSDEVIKGGYKSEDYFQNDIHYNRPVYNVPVSNLEQNTFTYYGKDLEEGDIVSFTLHHDVTRVDKAYKIIISKRGNKYIVEPIIPTRLSQPYQKILSTADSIILDVKKAVFKKGTPFRADNKGRGRIMYNKYQTGEARTYKNNMNNDQYDGYRVWRERQWGDGIEMYLDRDELMRFFARGTEKGISQFFASNKISDEKKKVIGEGHKLILERTTEDDQHEKAVDEATRVYSGEKNMSSLIDNMILRSRSKRRTRLLTALKDKIIQQDMKIKFGELNTVGLYARWSPDGTIIVDLDNLYEHDGRIDIDKVDRILFHEMVHGITKLGMLEIKEFASDIISLINDHFKIDPKTGKLTERPHAAKIIRDYMIENGYEPDMTTEFLETFYGFNDVYEFISEIMSNDEFARIMSQIKKEGENRNFLQKILDRVLEFFGLAKDFANDFIQIILNSPHVSSFTKEGANYRGPSGMLYGDVGQSFEVDVEPMIKTNVDEIRNNILNRAEAIRKRSAEVVIDKDEKGEELPTYSKIGSNTKLKRVTDRQGGFLSFFTTIKFDANVSFGQHMADLRWGKTDHSHEFLTDQGNMENYDQYKERMEKQSRQGMIKGTIMHLMLMRVANKLFKLGYDENTIVKRINDIASLSEGATKPQHYEWLEDPRILRKIFDQAGINVLKTAENFPEALRDIIYLPEMTVFSELLGFGGTIDALVGHADGKWSIKDWKTGRNFGKRTNTIAMKYGLQDIYISDNQRERSKLQVMLYAFLLKLEYPDMQFRDLMTVWIPDRFLAEREDMERFVEVNAYLNMIKAFLNDKQALKEAGMDPKIMEKILQKSPKIFNVSEYTDKASDTLFEDLKNSAFRPEEEYRRRVMEVQIILNRFIPGGKRKIRIDELPERDKKRLTKLYEEIAIIKSDPALQLDIYPQGDVGWITQWMGNYSDVNMGVFQTWVKIRNEKWNAYTQQHERDLIKMNRLVEPIYNEYMKGKIRISRGGYDRIANVNYAELFGWAYKEFEYRGTTEERLLTDKDPEWKNLTPDKQKLLTFMNNKFASWFVGENAYLNQQATVMYGKSYSWLDLYNFSRNEDVKMKHYEGWFPKTIKTYEEINYEEGARILNKTVGEGDIMGANLIGMFSAKRIKEAAKRKFTWFEEDQFEQYNDVTMSLPIKYLDSPNVINERNYTKNLVFMFDRFNKSMLHKQHMDSVYVTGQALQVFLQMKKHANGQPMFENTVGFLEKKLIGDIQNRAQAITYTGKPITFGKMNISPDKILEELIHWTSSTIMWLRPFQGSGNALFAKMITHREGLKGTIASKFLHIDGDAIDFTERDNIFADSVYFGSFQKDILVGDIRKNKLWLLARKLNYIPDNYDYATNKRFLMSTRNQALSESSMYKFYSIGEEYVSLTTMAAQLNHLKHPKNGRSLWDNYEVRTDENGETDVFWTGGIRGYEKVGKSELASYAPITELTTHEIEKLKKVHERLQGGYRKEETANVEIYVMGKAFIQFKRYAMRLIMNAFGGKRQEVSLGAYKKMDETRIDPNTGEKIDVYEWLARTNEGRWRTLANIMLTAANMGNPEYRWSTLSTEQKQNVVDAILSLGILALTYSAYILMFSDDDDDDTFKKWWQNYMVQNTSQQYNPMEMLRIFESMTSPVSIARAYKFSEAFGAMMIASTNYAFGNKQAAFTQKGDLKGWNEIMRSIPYMSAWHDISLKLQNASQTEQWWIDTFANKWR